jgi:CubicO group peptidase (beta-lactamase class C family)
VDIDELARGLDNHIPHVLRATHTPGVTVALAGGAGVLYSRAFGTADLADGSPMRPDHVMPGGSLSKVAVAVAVLQLAERRELSIHQPFTEYTDLDAINPFGPTAVTPYHLLTHQSGLRTDTYDASLGTPPPLGEHLAAGFASGYGREYGAIGSRWTSPVGVCQYSSFGPGALGYLVATANPAKLSFTDYVRRDIFTPLGLTSTCIPATHDASSVPPSILDRCCTGYGRFGSWCVPTPRLHSAIYPSTGVLTTAEDYAQLLAALFVPGHASYATLLRRETVLSMITPQSRGQHEGIGYEFGLGVAIGRPQSRDAWVGTRGQYPYGWNALAYVYPHHGLVLVALANCWDVVRWVNPPWRSAPGLIEQFVARSLGGDADPRTGSRTPWGYQSAYAAGLLMAERIGGLLSAEGGPLTAEAIAAMAAGARETDGDDDTHAWDPAAFVAGATAMTDAGSEPADIADLLRASLVPTADLDLHALSWGAHGAKFPVPMPFWASRQGEGESPRAPYLDVYRSACEPTTLRRRGGW